MTLALGMAVGAVLTALVLGGWIARERARSRADAAELTSVRADLAETERLLNAVNEELVEIVVDRNRQAERLADARDRADAANRAKSRFLATMSHELRTPLNSVIGFSNVLLKKRDELGRPEATYVERIAQNGRHLLDLIDQILDLAKIEAGRTEVAREPTDLEVLITSVADQLEGQALATGIPIRIDAPHGLAPVAADPSKLKQVLINLVGNALKFTDGGEVLVRVNASRDGTPTDLEVVDQGNGIPPGRLEAIFEPFEQADASTARVHGGAGLGLALSRQLCSLMGYGLEAASDVGTGSTFRIVFPAGLRVEAGGDPGPDEEDDEERRRA